MKADFSETMVIALMVLVFAVVVLGWLLAAVAFVATFVSLVSPVLDPPGASTEDGASRPDRWRSADAEFLRDVGIRP